MTDGIRIEGTEKFARAAKALNELGDKGVRTAVYKGFRETAKPLGERARDAGASRMPHRGGLSARVASARVGVRSTLGGSKPTVRITLNDGHVSMGALDRGIVRHPVFGNRKVWRTQAVPARAFSDEFEKGAPEVRARVIAALESVTTGTMRRAGL